MNPTHHQSPISTTMIVFVCSNCGTTCQQQQPSSSSSYMINTTSTTSPQQQRQQQFVEKRTLLCMKCEEMNIQFEQWKISSLSSSSGNSTPQSPLTPTTTRGVAVATSSPLSSPTLFHSPATSQFLFMQTQVASSTTNSNSSGSGSTLSSSPQQQRRIKKKPSVADQHCNPYAEAFVPQYHYSDNEDDENINNNNNKYDNGSSDVTDNETGAMMMEEEDEGFEYGDELNFLINRFGLQDQNKTRFMPYIN